MLTAQRGLVVIQADFASRPILRDLGLRLGYQFVWPELIGSSVADMPLSVETLSVDVAPPGIAKGWSVELDRETVAALDLKFQAATKANDHEVIDEILHQDYALVLGSGEVLSRQTLIDEARSGLIHYEIQDEEPGSQTVRMYGDTAVVTAKLWIKGDQGGKAFDRKIWFSDVYLRTQNGWRYAFAQTSGPLTSGDNELDT